MGAHRLCRGQNRGKTKTPPCPSGQRGVHHAVPLSCFTRRASIAAQTEGIAPPAPGRTFPAAGHGAACSRWPPLSVCLRCRYSSRSRRFYNTVPLYYQGRPAVSSGFLAVFPKIHPRGSLRNLQSVDCPPPLFPSLSPGGGDKGGGFWREPQAKSAALPENHPFAEIRPSRIPLQFFLHSVGRNKKITYSLLDSFPARSLL